MQENKFSIFSKKNPTPNKLAILAAVFISLLIALVLFFSSLGRPFGENITRTLVITFVCFFSAFLIFKYILTFFIYRKIKLIYKSISSSKNTKEKVWERVSKDEDVIASVGKEVLEWQKDRSEEIAELKRMESFRKEFIGNVSHELKTPLFSIQGYIHTLLEGAINDPEVNMNYLLRASKSVERLCLIVEDLEAISKLESGELTLDQRTFDIYELVKDVFDTMELKGKEMGITFDFKEESEKAVYVYGDKEKIRQVITNLIVNSVKYGKKGGKTLVGFYDMDQNILIEITDDGIGIDPLHLPRIFERFYRVDKSRSREQGGTGLGLSIVKHIIEAHEQKINVRSSLGMGTTFAFTLKKVK